MAEFSTPLATHLLGALDPIIAKGPDYSWIGNLPDAYWAGQNQQYLQRNRNAFQDPNSIPRTASGEVDVPALGTKLLQTQGTAGVPQFISLGNQGVAQELARRLEPTVPDVSGGYTPPVQGATGPPSSATAASAPEAQGTATPRQIAQARGLDLGQFMRATGVADPDAPLNYEQRQRAMAQMQSAPAVQSDAQEADSAASTRVASAFGDLPPSARPVQTVPVPGRQAQAGPVSAPAQAPPVNPALAPVPGQLQPQPQQVAQGQQLEREAAIAIVKAKAWEQRAAAADAAGNEGMAKTFRANAEREAKTASDIRQTLLQNSQLTTAEKDVRNPMVRGGAFTTEMDKGDVAGFQKQYEGAVALGQNASTMGLARIDELKRLTTLPNFYSGPLSKEYQTYQQFRSTFGSDPTSAQPGEAFNKGANNLLQEQIKGMARSGVGRVLQSEVRIMGQANANLENSPAGNRAVLEEMRRTYLQQQAFGQIANEVRQEAAAGRIAPGMMQATLNQRIDQYTRQNQPFTAEEKRNPLLLSAPDAPPNYQQMTLQQRQAWAAQNGVRRDAAIRLSNGVNQPWNSQYIHAD